MRIFGGDKARTERRLGEQYQASTGSNFKNYVSHNADLSAAYDRIASNWGKPLAEMNPTEREEMRYWKPRMGDSLSKEAFGKAHYGEGQEYSHVPSRDIAPAGQYLQPPMNEPGAGFVNPMTSGFLDYEPAKSGLLASNPLTKFELPEFTQWQARPGVLPDWNVVNPPVQEVVEETVSAPRLPDWQERWLQENQYITDANTGRQRLATPLDSYNALKAMQDAPLAGHRRGPTGGRTPIQSLKTSVAGLRDFFVPDGLLEYIRREAGD